MNTFLQRFSNCNLTNQSIVIYSVYILHQNICGTNLSNLLTKLRLFKKIVDMYMKVLLIWILRRRRRRMVMININYSNRNKIKNNNSKNKKRLIIAIEIISKIIIVQTKRD